MSPLILLKQVLTLLIFLVLGWILVHFMAVFGLFFAIALPILHLFFYPKIICFWCQLRGTPHRLAHSLIDSLLMVLVSLLSVAIVFGEWKLLGLAGFPSPERSVSFAIPARGQYQLGELFPLKIELKDISSAINVVQADLSFDQRVLRVHSVTTAGSFAEFFLQKDISNDLGYVRVTGGLPNPGYVANIPSLFATVYFQGHSPGTATVKFLDTSLVLANNGKGNNLLRDLPESSFVILKDPIPEDKLNLQKEMIIQEEESDQKLRSQLTFYEDKLAYDYKVGSILGQTSIVSSPSRLSRFLDALARLDHAIVELWNSIIS